MKADKRSRRKPATATDGGKRKRSIGLSAEASKRLDVHAAMREVTISDLVESLVMDHCREYDLPRRRAEGQTGLEAAER